MRVKSTKCFISFRLSEKKYYKEKQEFFQERGNNKRKGILKDADAEVSTR